MSRLAILLNSESASGDHVSTVWRCKRKENASRSLSRSEAASPGHPRSLLGHLTAHIPMAEDQTRNGKGQGFQAFATRVSYWAGSKWSFLGAIFVIIVWVVSGPYFHYSDTWQLVVNTATTIVTFLMVFLIQNSQEQGVLVPSI